MATLREFQVTGRKLDGTTAPMRLRNVPDLCPRCGVSIEPRQMGGCVLNAAFEVQLVYQCPRGACSELFIAIYRDEMGIHTLKQLTPIKPRQTRRSKNIENISSRFYDISDQAFAAEQYDLTDIAGPGYRKALEFLVKDFVLRDARETVASDTATKEEKLGAEARITDIEHKNLAACIRDDVREPSIVAVAERAAWLGNDEVHYVRRWEELDIDVLKQLIQATLAWIDLHETTRAALMTMPEGRK